MEFYWCYLDAFSPYCREFNSLQKNIQPFYIGPILFSENKIIRSVVGGKVDGQIWYGIRSEKPKILFGTRDEKWKNLFGAKWQLRKFYLAVKGLLYFTYVILPSLTYSLRMTALADCSGFSSGGCSPKAFLHFSATE